MSLQTRFGLCEVYWGSHGCNLTKGHDPDKGHWCSCCNCKYPNHPEPGCAGGPPYYGPDTVFYGHDAERLDLPGARDAADEGWWTNAEKN